MRDLDRFPELLRHALELIPRNRLRERTSNLFSGVEQAWHLADLEIEGYGARIQQLLYCDGPAFVDFAGDVIAAQRHYADLDLETALIRFAAARAVNLSWLAGATEEQRARRATQEGVEGFVTLGRIEEMMRQHDASHSREIVQILADFGVPAPTELRTLAAFEDPLKRTA